MHGLNYAPEEIGIGKYSGELVTFLCERGHDVVVVTAPPYYPEWKVKTGFKSWRYTRDSADGTQSEQPFGTSVRKRPADSLDKLPNGGLEVLRCPIWVPRRLNGMKRIVHLASFGLSSMPIVLWKAFRRRPDVIFVVEPTAFCLPTAWLASRLVGCKTWLHVQDFEIDAAFELGILKQPLLKRAIQWCEALWMRRFDRVSSISPNMLARLRKKKVFNERIRLFPNWVDCQLMRPLDSLPNTQQAVTSTAMPACTDSNSRRRNKKTRTFSRIDPPPVREGRRVPIPPPHLRKQFAIPADKCVALYAGNIGWKQGLEVVIQAAELAETCSDIHFVICGQGAAYSKLAELT